MKNRLKRIVVKGFQNHEHIIIDFDDVTTFVGGNDAGKSALLRALRFFCLNKPRGDGFINHDAERLFIKALVDDRIIKRKKDDKDNLYYIDGKKLKAFGAGKVPADVADILNIGEESFSTQHQRLFWFQDSPGQVSKELNKIVNLDVIDKVLSNVASDLRGRKSELGVTKARLKAAKKQKAELSWAVELNNKLQSIQKTADRIEKIDKQNEELRNAIEEYETRNRSVVVAEFQINVLDSAIAAGKKFFDCESKCNELSALIRKYENTQKLVSTPIPDLSNLDSLRENLIKADERCVTLKRMIRDVREIEKQNTLLTRQIKRAAKRIKRFEAKFRKCQTCGSMIPR